MITNDFMVVDESDNKLLVMAVVVTINNGSGEGSLYEVLSMLDSFEGELFNGDEILLYIPEGESDIMADIKACIPTVKPLVDTVMTKDRGLSQYSGLQRTI